MTCTQMVDALGGEASCDESASAFGGTVSDFTDCTWSDGVSASLDDEDRNGASDDGSAASYISVDTAFAGGTSDGLGIGASMRCFVDQLGSPDHVWFAWNADLDDYSILFMTCSSPSLDVYDFYVDETGEIGDPDGLADSLAPFGGGSF